MSGCMICPCECGADRKNGIGACGCGELPHIARAALHLWEEPFISGTRGSGAIFFSGCNLKCVFCQNYAISRSATGGAADASKLADIMLALMAEGAHNINLVTPTPHIGVIIPAIALAKERGLKIPIVYNTNAYEKAETLRRLEGLVDIYLPDLKYVSGVASDRYSGAVDYFDFASKAILEMHRQTGVLALDDDGLAKRGLIVRHLVLPCSVDEARRVLDFIAAELPKETYISLMSQYVPLYDAKPPIDRRLLKREYERAVDYCISLGFTNVLLQAEGCAEESFIPLFDSSLPPNMNKI